MFRIEGCFIAVDNAIKTSDTEREKYATKLREERNAQQRPLQTVHDRGNGDVYIGQTAVSFASGSSPFHIESGVSSAAAHINHLSKRSSLIYTLSVSDILLNI